MRRLGQHFLKDRSALRIIALALEIKNNDVILEIGSGHGELTDELIETDKKIKIIGIEKDNDLVRYLKTNYKSFKNIEVIEGDALKILPELSKKIKKYKLTGNIPYYITGFLFRTIGELKNKPQAIVLTIQKEVAERLSARPPKMNLLAASIGVWGIPEIIRVVKKTSFVPVPKVDSTIIRISLKKHPLPENTRPYYSLIRVLFKQPRKTILNNLSSSLNRDKKALRASLKKLDINPDFRPQNLKIEEIESLSALFKAKK